MLLSFFVRAYVPYLHIFNARNARYCEDINSIEKILKRGMNLKFVLESLGKLKATEAARTMSLKRKLREILAI